MKQRITHVVDRADRVDDSQIKVSNNALEYQGASAIEKRVTVGLDELPIELLEFFSVIHELHIRWTARLGYQSTSPFISRLPPGLHIFFTPGRTDQEVDICPGLRQIFGDIRCNSTLDSFSKPEILSKRFSSASTFQYYSPYPKILTFQSFLAKKVCQEFEGDCVNEVASLAFASSIDINYDVISHAVSFTAFWRSSVQSPAARTPARKWKNGDSVEVGVLHEEDPAAYEPEELKFGGYLTVIGEDTKPRGTLFSFPARHHHASLPDRPRLPEATYKVAFQQPNGLHPKLDITFPNVKALTPPKEACALHAYLTLPSTLFIDRYQLSDALFLASQNLVALHSLSGEQDLEAPDWVIKRWGSAALFELALPSFMAEYSQPDNDKVASAPWTVTIPTHLRYLQAPPNNTTPGLRELDIPWPTVFWACEAEDGLKMSTNPFDRVNLGYDGLFGPKTMFYHFRFEGEEGAVLLERLHVPVLEPENAKWLQLGTLITVMLGLGWVLWTLFRPIPTGTKAKPTANKME
ncbi:PIG-X-domain-containing protein [Teratosphaeria nubilosa]|uniref:Protein PBN1 n=1 Tax=Teratosphaeria nubilosa TaxID=161662 RepID=A0A6G1L293_9PEZI|nr:PIG-X-domain-containing protein [Teratosphaeria nubilosa]